jgi:hypothetical protein
MRATAAALAALLLAAPAQALVVEGGDPAAQESPPASDPGWDHVGHRGGPSAVYLGRGWVITAAHVGAGPFELGGTTYQAVAGSSVELENPRGISGRPDLMLYRVAPAPDLPLLPLRRLPPSVGAEVVLVGWGQGRGAPIELGSARGWRWAPLYKERWGTNRIFAAGLSLPTPGRVTLCFSMDFHPGGTAHEAQAALGDSGGAVFALGGGTWRLAGVMLSIGASPRQENDTTLPGNTTNAADISAYRAQILRILGVPDPAPRQPGGGAGAARRQLGGTDTPE